MQFEKIALNTETTQAVKRIESSASSVLRGVDRLLARLSLGGRKAPYDDYAYEFLGGPADVMRTKHYDKSLRLLWKAERHAPFLGFRDETAEEKELESMALRSMTPEEKSELKRIGGAEYRALLDSTYTRREKQAIVNVLSAIGHGEAYAWLVSAQLLAEVKSTGARAALTMQVLEEAKHFLVLRELIRAFEVPIPPLTAPEYLMLERVIKAKGVEKLFGMNVLVEAIALGLFGMMSHLPGLEILRLFHLDESRHTGLPNNYFKEFSLESHGKVGARAYLSRVSMLVPAILLIPTLEDDLAELGIDALDFGGSIIRKIATLAERNGFVLPVSFDTLLKGLDKALNLYAKQSRPVHAPRNYIAQETTKGSRELEIEGEVFFGKRASRAAKSIQAA